MFSLTEISVIDNLIDYRCFETKLLVFQTYGFLSCKYPFLRTSRKVTCSKTGQALMSGM